MNLRGKRVIVFGLGITGRSAVKFLLRKGAEVVAVDEATDARKLAELRRFARSEDIKLLTGDFDPTKLKSCELVVVSPGVSPRNTKLQYLRSLKMPIIGEVELGYAFCKAPIIAVTGSNGKTTTTALISHILNRFRKAYAVGNIGKAFVDVADKARADEVVCLEVSSFQLESCISFAPQTAVITNVTPDHLDRHLNFENYAELKRSITKNMKGGYVIYNAEDENLQPALFPKVPAKFIPFSSADELHPPCAYLENGRIVIDVKGARVSLETSLCKLPGIHNLENALAALSAARFFGAKKSDLEKGLQSFKGYEHRLEFVRELNGVRYFNDSKATNPEASITALKSFTEPIILIAGGRDKGTDLSAWARLVRERCVLVILIGEAKKRFEQTLKALGYENIEQAGTMEEAVERAVRAAKPGTIVLLSPACASFDMFADFEERGRIFKEAVNNL